MIYCDTAYTNVTLKLALHHKRRGHGRPGRVETGPLARTIPIRTTVFTALHQCLSEIRLSEVLL